ncbi:MAG TPA: wire protein, partial [Myxococcaceae bacterium]|nr:wire protein [Myxococcaceae bacterium]
GVEVEPVAVLEGPARRREIRRLAVLPVARVAPPAVAPARRSPVRTGRTAVAVAVEASAPSRAQAAAPRTAEMLCEGVLAELQTAMRGRSVPELVEVLRAQAEVVESACVLLTARGQVVRRGKRLFVA